MQKIRWSFLIVAIVLVLVVSLQNNHKTQIHLLMHEQTLPLWMLLLSTATIGFLLGALMTASMLRRRRKASAKKKNRRKTGVAKPTPPEPPTPATAESKPL